MTPASISTYARTLRAILPKDLFTPVLSRLSWLAAYLASIGGGMTLIAAHWGGWPATVAAMIIIGLGFAGLAFVGHELMHGAIVRNQRLRYVLGWICFLPFTMSPRLWVAWHNRVHHGHTMEAGVDPDAYPTLDAYQHSRFLRIADYLAPAKNRWLGGISLLLGFSIQSHQILIGRGRSPGYLTPRKHTLALLESLLGIAVWAALAWFIGPLKFLFAFFLPLVIANLVVMAYILTNHSLNPLTDTNDPLLNTLSVTTPRIFSLLHLNFGLHVEHHLFPAMSAAHAGTVRAALLNLWPERYQSMSLHKALWRLFTTPRIYKDPMTLIDPRDGTEYVTLRPSTL